MKHLKACLSARVDRESSYHHCRGPVRLVQACLCEGKARSRGFDHRGGAVKHVQACLSSREDQESCFRHCRRPVRLVQDCSGERKFS